MQLDIPDPAYAGSAKAQRHFRLAVWIAVGFVALLWIVHGINAALDLDPARSGIRPRQWAGLPGILFAPLVHGDFEHLLSNSLPLLVLLTTMVFLYPNSALKTLPAVWFLPGIAVWLFGRESAHFGASGLVYGLATYVLVAGLLRRDRRAIAASLVVWFLYGSLVWGVLPVPAGVSWETHLSAALVGAVLAVLLRRLDVLPLKRYAWEDDRQDDDEQGPPPAGGVG
ncbi:MAG: rhomboid family intramembrane serine protease [Burkholderiales bacterium]